MKIGSSPPDGSRVTGTGAAETALLPASAPWLAVENATKMSPEPLPCVRPHATHAEAHAAHHPPQLIRRERRVGADHDDDRALLRLFTARARGSLGRHLGPRAHRRVDRLGHAGFVPGDFAADRNARDAELGAQAVVALHQRAHDVAPSAGQLPRRGAGAALEAVAEHPGAAAHIALGNRPPRAASSARIASSAFTCWPFWSFRRPSDVSATTGYQKAPVAPFFTIQDTAASRTTPTLSVLVMRIGVSSTPLSSIQWVPVMSPLPLPIVKAANTGGEVAATARQNGGDAGPNRTLPDLALPFARDQRGVPHRDAGDVGDGVERTGRAVERHAEVTRPGLGLGAASLS